MQYRLIGEHLGHSYSVPIHRLISGEDYELREIAPADLGTFMIRKEFRAINVTIPYKQDVIPYLDEISDTAREIGAVNTIVNRDGCLYGTNTDAPARTLSAGSKSSPQTEPSVQCAVSVMAFPCGMSSTSRSGLHTPT